MNKRVQYLIEGITKDIIAYLMEDNVMDMPAAIILFYNSETFEKLSDEATGLYIESSAYIYEILKLELKMGKDSVRLIITKKSTIRSNQICLLFFVKNFSMINHVDILKGIQ